MDHIDIPLDPVLEKLTFKQGGIDYISLGDNIIPFSPNFRLYITTSLRNPHFLPEVFNKVTVINFALTLQGLEDQLLGIVVAKERPDLQELRQSLIVDSAKNKEMLKIVEDNIQIFTNSFFRVTNYKRINTINHFLLKNYSIMCPYNSGV